MMKQIKETGIDFEVLHTQAKSMKDKEGKEINYYELTILCSKFFEGVQTITSSENLKVGKQKRDFLITAKNDELKLKLIKLDGIPNLPKN